MGEKRLIKSALYACTLYAIIFAYAKTSAQDFDGSSSYNTSNDALIACTQAKNAWQDVYGALGGSCTTGTFYYNLNVEFTGGGSSVQQRFYWSTNNSYTNLQEEVDDLTSLTLAINDDLNTAEAQISETNTRSLDNETRSISNTSRIGTNETDLVNANNRLTVTENDIATLQSVDALIEIDTNANAQDIANLQSDLNTTAINLQGNIDTNTITNNLQGIQINELYIENEVQETQIEENAAEFEAHRAASEANQAETNDILELQQVPLLQAISTNTAQTNTQLTSIETLNSTSSATLSAIQGLNTDNGSNMNALIAQQTDTNSNLSSLLVKATDTNSNLSSNIANLVQLNNAAITTNSKLDTLTSAVNGVSFDITGTNISIDNSGVESRLTDANSNLNSIIQNLVQLNNETIEVDAELETLNNTINNGSLGSSTVTSPIASNFDQAATNFYNAYLLTDIGQMFSGASSAFSGIPADPSCPAISITAAGYFSSPIGTDVHCTLYDSFSSIIAALMLAVWAFIAFRIIGSA